MNNKVFFFFYNLAHQSELFDKIVVFVSVYFPAIVVLLAAIFLLFHHDVFKSKKPFAVFRQKKKEILAAFLVAVLAWFFAYILKFFFHALRPFDAMVGINPLFLPDDYGFPSGHVTFFTALAVSIFFTHKGAGYLFISFALLIGVARVIAGVHFPVDILYGFFIGFIISYVYWSVFRA